jgi:hypothetical protein
MTNRGLHRGSGALLAVALGVSIAACGGVVPLGTGPDDGGSGGQGGSSGGGQAGSSSSGGGGGSQAGSSGSGSGGGGQAGSSSSGGDQDDAGLDDAGNDADVGTGTDDAAACTLAISSGSYATDPVACDSCMAASCCEENVACGANSACVVTLTCAIVCESQGTSSNACVQCMAQRGAADPAYTNLEQCMGNYCNLASEACFPLFP